MASLATWLVHLAYFALICHPRAERALRILAGKLVASGRKARIVDHRTVREASAPPEDGTLAERGG